MSAEGLSQVQVYNGLSVQQREGSATDRRHRRGRKGERNIIMCPYKYSGQRCKLGALPCATGYCNGAIRGSLKPAEGKTGEDCGTIEGWEIVEEVPGGSASWQKHLTAYWQLRAVELDKLTRRMFDTLSSLNTQARRNTDNYPARA